MPALAWAAGCEFGPSLQQYGFPGGVYFSPLFFFRDYVSNGPKPALSPKHHNLLETQRAPLSPSFEPQSLGPDHCSQYAERSQKVFSSGLATAERIVLVPCLEVQLFFRLYLILFFSRITLYFIYLFFLPLLTRTVSAAGGGCTEFWEFPRNAEVFFRLMFS